MVITQILIKPDFPQKAFICPPLDVGDPVQIAAKKGQRMGQLPVHLLRIDNKGSEWSVTQFWKVASPGPEAGPRGQVSDEWYSSEPSPGYSDSRWSRSASVHDYDSLKVSTITFSDPQ